MKQVLGTSLETFVNDVETRSCAKEVVTSHTRPKPRVRALGTSLENFVNEVETRSCATEVSQREWLAQI